MKIIYTLLFSATVQIFFWQAATAQPLTKIRIGYPSISSRQGQLWIAKDEGLFRKYGLDVELIFLRGGQVAVQALASGDPPLVTVGNVILANLQGYDNVLIASVENSYDQIVFVRPGTAARVEQLKGKKFGISGFGTATHNAAVILFLSARPRRQGRPVYSHDAEVDGRSGHRERRQRENLLPEREKIVRIHGRIAGGQSFSARFALPARITSFSASEQSSASTLSTQRQSPSTYG